MPFPCGDTTPWALPKRLALRLAISLTVLTSWIPLGYGQSELSAVTARAANGDPEALNALANAYAGGQGVGQDFTEAIRLYQQAAARGHAAAHFNLGLLHELGRGVTPDVAAAFEHYLKAAELGFPPAQFNVGNMYANGSGVPQDLFAALLWFRQAASRGVPEAQYNVALAYEHGRGVAQDEPLAQRWYRAAAEQGYVRAQFNLALMLAEGRGGPPDRLAAVSFYRSAATQSFAPAQHNLGLLLSEGNGVPVNLVEAYKWLALAVENGMPSTQRDQVALLLSPADLLDANLALAAAGSRSIQAASAASPGHGANTPTAGSPATSPRPVTSREFTSLAPSPMANPMEVAPAASIPAKSSLPKSRLLDRAPLGDTTRSATGNPLGLVESSFRNSAPATPPADIRQVAIRTSEIPLEQLASNDPRIAKLLSENARLNDEITRSTLRVVQLTRRVASAEERSAAVAPARRDGTAADGDPRVAELIRQNKVLRSTVSKLAEENRWHVAAASARTSGIADTSAPGTESKLRH
jgi:TPR repeat protein